MNNPMYDVYGGARVLCSLISSCSRVLRFSFVSESSHAEIRKKAENSKACAVSRTKQDELIYRLPFAKSVFLPGWWLDWLTDCLDQVEVIRNGRKSAIIWCRIHRKCIPASLLVVEWYNWQVTRPFRSMVWLGERNPSNLSILRILSERSSLVKPLLMCFA